MDSTEQLTVEQFAQRVGMTVRNIREWQTLGLLPPPDKQGRIGVYGPGHVAQVQRIQQLKADGFPLSLIRRMFEREPRSENAVRGLASAVLEPFHAEEPIVLKTSELRRRLKLGARAPVTGLVERGLIHDLGNGQVRVRSPLLLHAFEEAIRHGFAVDAIVGSFERIQQHHRAIAETLIGFYREHIWEPFLNAGMPTEGWANITQLTGQLRPLVYDAVLAAFQCAVDDVTEQTIVEEAKNVPPELLRTYAPNQAGNADTAG